MSYNNQFYPMYSQQQIVRVNGENGARAYQLPPNSSALLLDDTAPLVWLVQTDGAGYKTLSPFAISKYEPEPQPDFRQLMDRLTRLEDRLNEESYRTNAERRSGQSERCDQTADAEQSSVCPIYER